MTLEPRDLLTGLLLVGAAGLKLAFFVGVLTGELNAEFDATIAENGSDEAVIPGESRRTSSDRIGTGATDPGR